MDVGKLARIAAIKLDKRAAERALIAYQNRWAAWLMERREHFAEVVRQTNDPRLTEYWRRCEEWWDADEQERARYVLEHQDDTPSKEVGYLHPLLEGYVDPFVSDKELDAIIDRLRDDIRAGRIIE